MCLRSIAPQSAGNYSPTRRSLAAPQYVIQLAKDRGLKSINLIRARDSEAETQKLKDELHELGATLVTTAEALKEDLKASGLPAPKLALDCVGGPTAVAMAKSLE